MNSCVMRHNLGEISTNFYFYQRVRGTGISFLFLGRKIDIEAYICDKQRCEICKEWNDTTTVLV